MMMTGMGPTDILVVADLPELRLAYAAALNELGQNVIAVRSGEEAAEQAMLSDFSVILIDVELPGMDGFETAGLIRSRQRSASTPIIFATAFPGDLRLGDEYLSGAVDILLKPVMPEVLRAKVRVFVELFQMRQMVALQAEHQARHLSAEDANRRLSFLADAGAVLGRSLDFEATVRDTICLPVPRLSDISGLIHESRGNIPRTSVSARIAADGAHAIEQLNSQDPVSKELWDAMQLAMGTGERISLLRPDPEGEGDSIYCLAFPLKSRGRTTAVVALLRDEASPNFSSNDVIMAAAFSSRAAIALENAVLHDELQAADQQKNSFLSMLAHELRNPLAPLRNASHLLGMRAPDQPDLQWIREVIDRQVVQMVRLVDDLLDISRITQGKIRLQCEPVELATVVAHAVEASQPLIDARQHALNVSLPDQPVWIHGDLARLAQVLTNLLNNAAKYTEDGGQIWLSAGTTNDTAVISVRDSGNGIPPHMIQAIFDLFTQVDRTLDRSQGGLGIGLTLVRQLTEMHGGTVTARSDGPGTGAEFTVQLPVIAAVEGEPGESAIPGETVAWQATILVVDDNVDSADTMCRLLQADGHRVHVAYDGQTGLAAAQEHEPSIILLDIGLPGMDGYSVARRLRELPRTRGALLIAMTGYGQHTDEQQARDAGFNHHLIKPVEFETLSAILSSAKSRK